jgi:hypothetical protein
MNRAQTRMYRMIERFEESRGAMSIGDYFQVPMKIKINHENILNIVCSFSQPKKCYVKLDLPFEVNCIVLSYLDETTFGDYLIIVPYDYPFKPPIWLLIKSSDLNHSIYKKAEVFQNSRYQNSWEPSISFEKDILYMIESIYLNQ